MQIGFFFDQTRCTGCCTCVIACKDWHSKDSGSPSWIAVKTIEKGRFPFTSVSFFAGACYHCAEPMCVSVCPANAIVKRESDGIVVVQPEKCLGADQCQLCKDACPYDAPKFSNEKSARMEKCDLCLERLSQGKNPVCVDACPVWALEVCDLAELQKKHGNETQAEGFSYDPKIKPSVVFKAKKKQR